MKIHLIWIMCIHFLNRKWEWNNILCSPFILTFCVFQIKEIFLPLSKCKMSQIKIANSRDSWILCLHSSQLSVSQDFPVFQKYQKHLFRETIALSSLPLAPVTLDGTLTPQALSCSSEIHAHSWFLAHVGTGWSVWSFLGASIIDVPK